MKKYCLTDKAKNQLGDAKDLIIVLGLLILGMVIVLCMFVLTVHYNLDTTISHNKEDNFIILLIGWIGWAIVLPIGAIVFKRWIQNSVEEC